MKNGYIKSLDGLRFLAVTFVLADHWTADRLGFPASYLGVCMFFVLSGFLITRILLSAKEKDAELNRGHGFSLKRFFIRRTIRIFPLYYAVLGGLFLLNVPPVREKFMWLFSYMTNNYLAIHNTWMGSVDHLWSLAVEEQFYIFFPFVVLFLPLKWLPKTFTFFVIFAVFIRAVLYYTSGSWIPPYVLTPACLDAFGLGALLAFMLYYDKTKILNVIRSRWSLLAGIAFYALLVLILKNSPEAHNAASSIWLRLGESMLSVSLMGFLITNKSHVFTRFFEWNPLVYIGKISYGIYIFHNFLYNEYHPIAYSPGVKLVNWLNESNNIVLASLPVRVILLYGMVVVVATLSWYLFEKPINKLKDKYGY
jgi:peptidoglycan/LPS O-acetylase OafA/YrhL